MKGQFYVNIRKLTSPPLLRILHKRTSARNCRTEVLF